MDYSKLVESLKKQDANRKCFDCGVVGTTYASLNFGTFVCSQCAGILRGLNFKVKPLGISIFTLNEYEILQKNGNEKAKYIWMGLFDPYKHEKPDPKNYKENNGNIKNNLNISPNKKIKKIVKSLSNKVQKEEINTKDKEENKIKEFLINFDKKKHNKRQHKELNNTTENINEEEKKIISQRNLSIDLKKERRRK